MSMNGDDSHILRNHITSSKTSIYDYPEHLNPFYEDENHKRLRFWNINKNKNSENNGRRNSFSLGGLKEMWAFKSFRLKKKSSTLGINKTSESPPTLRRDVEANYGTYDPRMRNTTHNNVGDYGNFDRNVPYRSSLQDMRLTQTVDRNNFGFRRNDKYRSTMQTPSSGQPVPSRRYVYGGSVTPQPVRCNVYNDGGIISRGSSQISVASTNPFDGDDDDNDVIVGHITAESTPTKRPARKKRRAPPPPVPVHQIITETSVNYSPSELNEPVIIEEDLNISHLTAEIENYVKTSSEGLVSNNDENTNVIVEIEPNSRANDPADNQNINPSLYITEENCAPKRETLEIKESVSNLNTSETPKETIIVETVITQKELVKSNSITNVNELPKEKIAVEIENQTKQIEIEQASHNDTLITSTKEEAINNLVLKLYPLANVSEIELRDGINGNPNSVNCNEELACLKINEEALVIEALEQDNSSINLKITEVNDISQKCDTSESYQETPSNFQAEYIPLKESFPKVEPAIHTFTSKPVVSPKPILYTFKEKVDSKAFISNGVTSNNETGLYRVHHNDQSENENCRPVAPERRRSVRDIIASINHSQSLLKVNQDLQKEESLKSNEHNNLDNPEIKTSPRKNNVETINYRSLAETEIEIKRMLEELEKPNNVNERKYKNNEENMNGILDDLADSLNNNINTINTDGFKKCLVKTEISQSRESSPTTSNLDWNPLPKPKRTKNLSPELKLSNNVN